MTAPSKVPATPRHQHTFYEARSVPIHNVRLIRSREAALAYPTGDIVLSIDENSGLIQNIAFEPDKVLYDEEYEETQGFSQTFQEFQKQLAQSLIERHDLTNKRILEIGCGKGEFISLMCELGDNEGVGFDPAFIERRNPDPTNRVTFFSEFFTEKHTASSYDLVCCKMTLEHIHRPNLFMRMLRRAIGNAVLPVVFFQVPNSLTIFRDTAFWDIYYEHCNYFSAGSLGRLFQTNGFRVDRIWTDYHDQYLMVEARPAPDRPGEQATAEDSERELEDLFTEIEKFSQAAVTLKSHWRALLDGLKSAGKTTAIWGAGSKAVGFLTTLGITDQIVFGVDINPYRSGTFLAGCGHEIVSPDLLKSNPTDIVVVMNPVYENEIKAACDSLIRKPTIVTVADDPALLVTQLASHK